MVGHLFPQNSLTLVWVNNYTHYKMWEDITFLFPNFNGCTVEVWEWISNFISHFTEHVITYPCLGLKLNYVSKRSPGVAIELSRDRVIVSLFVSIFMWKMYFSLRASSRYELYNFCMNDIFGDMFQALTDIQQYDVWVQMLTIYVYTYLLLHVLCCDILWHT